MSRSGLLGFILAFLVLSFLAPGAQAAPAGTVESGGALWQRAVRIAGHSANMLPASIHTIVTISDGNNQVKSEQETWSRISVDESGKVVTTVIRGLKDGRDDTAQAQAQVDRAPNRSRFDYAFLPVMPDNQDKVSASLSGKTRRINGALCTGYRFTMELGKGRTSSGTAWLDSASGALLEMTFTFEPLPTGAREIETVLHFSSGPDEDWHLTSLSSYGLGQILFFKRIFRMQMQLSDYFAYRPQQEVAGTAPPGAMGEKK